MSGQLKQIKALSNMNIAVMNAHANEHNLNENIISGTQNNFSIRFFSWHT